MFCALLLTPGGQNPTKTNRAPVSMPKLPLLQVLVWLYPFWPLWNVQKPLKTAIFCCFGLYYLIPDGQNPRKFTGHLHLCTNYPSSKFCSNCTLSDPIETSKNPKNGQNGQFSTFCALFSFLPPGGQNPKKPIGHQHPCPNYPSSKFRANCTLSDHFGTSKTPKNS